jgi:dipeptidyl aminopeptidase/acylaminoacyl peptidase
MRWFALFAAVVWTPLAAAEPEDAVMDRVAALGRIGAVFAGSLSPDGKTAAVSTTLTGAPQIWTVPTQGGWPRQLTAFEDPASSPLWSPRGDLIAFTVSPGGGLNTQVYVMRPDGSGLKRMTAGGKENNFLGEWTHDGRWLGISTSAPGASTTESALVDPRTGERQAVATSEGLGSVLDVTRDGKWALLERSSGRGNNDLYLVELPTRRELHLTPHQGAAEYSGQFGPDGRVFLQSDEGRDRVAFGELVLGADRTPRGFRVLAERPDADVVEFRVEPSGRRALVLWNVAGRHELSWVDLKSGKAQRAPALPAELAYKMRFSHDGRALLFTSFGSAMPLNAFVLDVATGKTRQLSEAPHPGVELSTLVRPELLQFQAHDGEGLSGWLYLPKQFARPGPIVLSFHGGPEEQEYPAFRPDYQALLSAGIAVFAPNVRGSSGFGKRFLHLDDREKRVDAVRDIEAAWNAVVGRGIADARRVGVMGGSYGGYMTLSALTEYPDKFAAGATLCGIVNFETFFANTEGWMAAISTVEYGDPKTQRELLRQLSPVHKLDRIRAATLVMHGANDTNVPVIEAEQVVETLKKRGVPVEYLLFPDEGHGWRKPANRARSAVTLVSFFSRFLVTDSAPPAAKGR